MPTIEKGANLFPCFYSLHRSLIALLFSLLIFWHLRIIECSNSGDFQRHNRLRVELQPFRIFFRYDAFEYAIRLLVSLIFVIILNYTMQMNESYVFK